MDANPQKGVESQIQVFWNNNLSYKSQSIQEKKRIYIPNPNPSSKKNLIQDFKFFWTNNLSNRKEFIKIITSRERDEMELIGACYNRVWTSGRAQKLENAEDFS